MPASSLTLWSRLSMIGGLCREAGSCTTAIEAANTSPSDTPSAWRRLASSPRWVASATRTIMLSPKPSTASTRPRSSIGVDHGAHARPSSSPRSNGSTGSTIAGCWNPSATSRRSKPRSATTPCWMSQLGPRDSNQTASDQPGAVQGWTWELDRIEPEVGPEQSKFADVTGVVARLQQQYDLDLSPPPPA